MIERKFVKQNMAEFRIKEFVRNSLSRAGLSDVKLMRTPLGEKIVVYASRPGLVVGRGGANISQLTKDLKNEFELENPQVEIEEVTDQFLDPNIVAEMITNSLEKFGSNRFKGIGYRALSDVMQAGARGVEILISGKIPSARARNWRFYSGYLKKCGDIALTGVDSAYSLAKLKSGAVGIKVSIMPPTTKLPDDITVHDPDEPSVEEVKEKEVEEEMKEKTTELEKTAEVEEEPEKKAKKEEGTKKASKANKKKPSGKEKGADEEATTEKNPEGKEEEE